jgi:hypothetical protein
MSTVITHPAILAWPGSLNVRAMKLDATVVEVLASSHGSSDDGGRHQDVEHGHDDDQKARSIAESSSSG